MRILYFDKKNIRLIASVAFVCLICLGAWVAREQDDAAMTAAEDSGSFSRVVDIGEAKNDAVSLMFMVDENTDNSLLAETMQVLSDNDIRATFFITGKFAENHKDVVLSLTDYGHEIGVSGYEAVSPANLDYGENMAALEKATTVIRNITGSAVHLYSPPFGVLEEDIYKAVNESELKYILAGVDSLDWDDVSTEAIISTVLTKVEKGSLISFHATEMTNRGLQTIINEIKGLKLKFLPVGENIA